MEIEHKSITTNGIKMHVAQMGTGPLVLLCHGFPESWYSWRHQLKALADVGYCAVAPDMRGYGQTDPPEDIDQYTLFHLTGDMVGLVDALGFKDCMIVGHDWGASVARHSGLFRPDKFKAVIALSVPYRPRGDKRPTTVMPETADSIFYQLYFQKPGVAEADLEKDVRRSLINTIFFAGTGNNEPTSAGMVYKGAFWDNQIAQNAVPSWITETDVNFYATEFERSGFRGGLNWYRNIDRNWELLASWAGAKVTVPALYIVGDHDIVFRLPGVDKLIPNLPNFVPQLRETITLRGCGHWTPEERVAEVNSAIIEFLDGLKR